ncbi:MAG: glycosyltransferase [Rhodospirillales bacterium]|nr:glycosyltransferase [Rhodospirillales bacterium]
MKPTGRPLHRVLHLINGEHYSGAERVQDLLAQHLPAFGFDVEIACLKPNLFPKQMRARNVPLHTLPMRSKVDLGIVLALARKIRERGYSLIHTHTPRTALIGRPASLLARIPFVYHVHSPAEADSTDVWRNRINSLIERVTLVGADHLITVCEPYRADFMARGFRKDRISVVLNGIEHEGPLRAWTPPTNGWRIGTVALFRPRKGLENLLRALAMLVAEGYDISLLAVGPFESPDYEREIRALSETLGLGNRIQWTGFTSDVDSEFARMDIFVLPSLFGEGNPMVIIEAMANGVPVIATRLGGIPDVVRNGIDGCLVAPGDDRALADAIRAGVTGQMDLVQMRESAYERRHALLSAGAMAHAVAGVYEKVLSA